MRKSAFDERYRRHFRRNLCPFAQKQHDGKCLGYGISPDDDEPCDYCKECRKLATRDDD